MNIQYKEISRREEPWGVDVSIEIYDADTQGRIQLMTYRFDDEKQIDQDLASRAAKTIAALLATSHAGLDTRELGVADESGCAHSCVNCGGGCKIIDVSGGRKSVMVPVQEVEQILKDAQLITTVQTWDDYKSAVTDTISAEKEA